MARYRHQCSTSWADVHRRTLLLDDEDHEKHVHRSPRPSAPHVPHRAGFPVLNSALFSTCRSLPLPKVSVMTSGASTHDRHDQRQPGERRQPTRTPVPKSDVLRGVLSLQQLVGNRAVSGLLQPDVTRSTPSPESPLGLGDSVVRRDLNFNPQMRGSPQSSFSDLGMDSRENISVANGAAAPRGTDFSWSCGGPVQHLMLRQGGDPAVFANEDTTLQRQVAGAVAKPVTQASQEAEAAITLARLKQIVKQLARARIRRIGTRRAFSPDPHPGSTSML